MYSLDSLICSSTPRPSGVCWARYAYQSPEENPLAGVQIPIRQVEPHAIFIPTNSAGKAATRYPVYNFQDDPSLPSYGCSTLDTEVGTVEPFTFTPQSRPTCIKSLGASPFQIGPGCSGATSSSRVVQHNPNITTNTPSPCTAPTTCPSGLYPTCTGGWQCVGGGQQQQPCQIYSCRKWECTANQSL